MSVVSPHVTRLFGRQTPDGQAARQLALVVRAPAPRLAQVGDAARVGVPGAHLAERDSGLESLVGGELAGCAGWGDGLGAAQRREGEGQGASDAKRPSRLKHVTVVGTVATDVRSGARAVKPHRRDRLRRRRSDPGAGSPSMLRRGITTCHSSATLSRLATAPGSVRGLRGRGGPWAARRLRGQPLPGRRHQNVVCPNDFDGRPRRSGSLSTASDHSRRLWNRTTTPAPNEDGVESAPVTPRPASGGAHQ